MAFTPPFDDFSAATAGALVGRVSTSGATWQAISGTGLQISVSGAPAGGAGATGGASDSSAYIAGSGTAPLTHSVVFEVAANAVSGSQTLGVLFDYDSGTGKFYLASIAAGGVGVYYFDGAAYNAIGSTVAHSLGDGFTRWLITRTQASAGANVAITVQGPGGVSLSVTDTAGKLPPTTNIGLEGVGVNNQTSGILCLRLRQSLPIPVMTKPTLRTFTKTAIYMSATAATGGSGGYTYQYHRSEDCNFTPAGGTALAGQTDRTALADTTALAGHVYWYVCQATDSNGTPSVLLDSLANGTSGTPACLAGSQPVALMVVGDSNSITPSPPTDVGSPNLVDYEAGFLSVTGGTLRHVIYVNGSLGSRGTPAFLPDAPVDVGPTYNDLTLATNAFAAAITAQNYPPGIPPLRVCEINHGTNDCVPDGYVIPGVNGNLTPAEHAANLQAIADYLIAGDFVDVVVISSSIYLATPAYQESAGVADATLTLFRAAEDALANGSTILRGDRGLGFQYTGSTPSSLYYGTITSGGIGVHMVDAGHRNVGLARAQAMYNVVFHTGSSGGGSNMGFSAVVEDYRPLPVAVSGTILLEDSDQRSMIGFLVTSDGNIIGTMLGSAGSSRTVAVVAGQTIDGRWRTLDSTGTTAGLLIAIGSARRI